jgi:hypothetical protein
LLPFLKPNRRRHLEKDLLIPELLDVPPCIFVPAYVPPQELTLPENPAPPSHYAGLFRGKRGLELGGPSPQFSSVLDLYSVAASVDNLDYGLHTLWGRMEARLQVAGGA